MFEAASDVCISTPFARSVLVPDEPPARVEPGPSSQTGAANKALQHPALPTVARDGAPQPTEPMFPADEPEVAELFEPIGASICPRRTRCLSELRVQSVDALGSLACRRAKRNRQ